MISCVLFGQVVECGIVTGTRKTGREARVRGPGGDAECDRTVGHSGDVEFMSKA